MIFLVLLLLLGQSRSDCPNGTITIPAEFGSKWNCLLLENSKKSFIIAESQCIESAGHLTSIANGFINLFVVQEASSVFSSESNSTSRFWIGVNDVNENGWQNTDDNSNATFFDWAPGEPASATGTNGCVSVDFKGLWYNDNCFNNYSYVCEVPEISIASTSQPVTTPSPFLCRSYFPFAVDLTQDITSDQLSRLKNFIATSLVPEIFPIDVRPSPMMGYNGQHGGSFYAIPDNVSDLIYEVNNMEQWDDTNADIYLGLWALTELGLYNYRDDISVNLIVFAGNVSNKTPGDSQDYINNFVTDGSTVTVVFVNSGYHMPGVEKLTNVNIIQWSEDSTELVSNIRRNMKCGSEDTVYRPCKRWFSFIPDWSNILSETNFDTQITFIQKEIGKMNRPDKIQLINTYSRYAYRDWNSGLTISALQSALYFPQNYTAPFSLKGSLQKLSDIYYSKNTNEFQPPLVALVFVTSTSTYENYGGADEAVQKLKDAGFQLTFFLMGWDVDETKLTNYTTNFVYWRNMNNPQPENWDEVRLKAYNCA